MQTACSQKREHYAMATEEDALKLVLPQSSHLFIQYRYVLENVLNGKLS